MKIATNSHCFVLIYCSLWDRGKKGRRRKGRKWGKGKDRRGKEGRKESVRKSPGYSHMKFHVLTKAPTLKVE